jgi:hypothetical protein
MKKMIVVGLAIIAVSTSAALAKKPKASAAAPTTSSAGLLKGSDADMAMYKKNLHDSGMKK